MTEIVSDMGPALILETTLSDRDVKALHDWATATVEAERKRCEDIVHAARFGARDNDLSSIIAAIRRD